MSHKCVLGSLPPLASSLKIQELSSPTDFLKAVLETLDGRDIAFCRQLMGIFQEKFPKEAGRVFHLAWEKAGKPTHKTAPGIAHPQFGRLAFLDQEGRSISTAQKKEVLAQVLNELNRPELLCPFCDPETIKTQTVYSDGKYWHVFQSLTPVTQGHLHVIPMRHVTTMDQLTEEESAALAAIVKKCANAFEKLYGSREFVVVQKNGPSAGQSVNHVHFHIVHTEAPHASGSRVSPQIFKENKRFTPDEMTTAVRTLRLAFEATDPILAQCAYLETLITPEPSLVNLAIQWRLESLLDQTDEAGRRSMVELLKKVENGRLLTAPDFYTQLERMDGTFRATALPFIKGRDRHETVTPYPFNQIHLSPTTPMNGSRVKFPETGQPYLTAPTYCIAMSAPMPDYIPQTLHMYRKEGVEIVVNLTDFEEGPHIKAHRYLPDTEGEATVWGDCKLTTMSITEKPLSSTWTLQEKRCEVSSGEEPHLLTQFHVQGWKDFTPGDPEAIARLIREVTSYERKYSGAGKIAVHCSGGVGRTGVFIAGKKIYEMIQAGMDPDIREIAAVMRMQRHYLGGSKQQYQVLWRLKEIFQEQPGRARMNAAAERNEFASVKEEFAHLSEKTRHALCKSAYEIARETKMDVGNARFGEQVFTELSNERFHSIRLQAIQMCFHISV